MAKLKASAANVEAFIEKAKRFRSIDELTPELLRLFIQRIEIGERAKKYSHSAAQDIRIVYRDIGMVDSDMEKGEQPVHMATLPQNIDEVVKMLAYRPESTEADGFRRPPLLLIMDRSQNVPMNTIRSLSWFFISF